MRSHSFLFALCIGLYNTPAHSFQHKTLSKSQALPFTFPAKVASSSNEQPLQYMIDELRLCRNTRLRQTSSSSEGDMYFNPKATVALVGGQSILVLIAALLGTALGVPNKGLGPNVVFDLEALRSGVLYTLPLVGLAAALDVVEDKVPALQDVTKATHRSVLSLLGGTLKPFLGIITATILGVAAGFGEEMLFRGILQYEIVGRLGSPSLAVGASSILFGALHAVTPWYAALASLASVYFGAIYLSTGNLAVPILCHALYDVGALLFAHWTISRMNEKEKEAIANWSGPVAGPL